LKNVGAVGGRNFGLPIDLAHRLYSSILLPHKQRKSLKSFGFSTFYQHHHQFASRAYFERLLFQ